jgi:murein DD-endopeptidase MepM/ murein hydrolase activator NlpD
VHRKKCLAIFMILIALFAFLPTAEALATAEMRAQLRELEQRRAQARYQLRESENILSGLRAEIQDLMALILEYSQSMVDAQADLDEIEFVLLETQILKIEAEEELAQASEDRDRQEVLFHARLRAMHEQGTAGHLSVLFQATCFTDFLVRLEHVRAISQLDQHVLEDMQQAEERVANTVEELSRLNLLLTDMHYQQEAAVQALDEAIAANELFLISLQEDATTQALMVEIDQATLRAVDEEFGVVQRQIREHEEEEERRRIEAERQERLRRQQADLARFADFTGTFIWPIPTHSHVSSYFGPRTHPIRRRPEHHTGIDVPAPSGTRINAAARGIVRTAGVMGGFGLTVIIDHGNGYSTLYAHNSRNRVTVGQEVAQGQHIADVGSTGTSTGPHLHFEIRRNGVPINPREYLPMLSR